MKSLAWMDGSVLPLVEARIALDDAGFLLGDGVFESLRVHRGRPFRWDLHAQRLKTGLAIVGIDVAAVEVAQQAVETLAEHADRQSGEAASLRVQVARTASGEGQVTALLRALPQYPKRLYRDGARLIVAAWRRDPDDPLCRVKSLSFLSQTLARREAQAQGFDDALIMNRDGRVCEASYANVIARCGNTLYAPGTQEGALDGVTRRVLLEDGALSNYDLQGCLNKETLMSADEMVLTSTYAGVIPVTFIDSVHGDYAGPSGELAQLLTQRYSALLGEGA